jgi:hypothetical protein
LYQPISEASTNFCTISGFDRGAVGRKAVVGQQVDHGIKALRPQTHRLADAIALLHRFFVGHERPDVENIGFELFVLEAVLGLHPLPEAELAVFADEGGGRFGQVRKLVVTLPGVGKNRLRVFLENRGYHHGRHTVFHVVEAQQQVARHQEINLPGGQKGAVVHLRAALGNFHVQPHPFVGSVSHSLVKAAVTRLRPPVRAKNDFLLCKGACSPQNKGAGSY